LNEVFKISEAFGGREDQSLKVIHRYAPYISYWISEPDRGQSHAINKGFERCTGDLVAFIGSDDVYLPGTFHDVAERFVSNPQCGAVAGGFIRIDKDSLAFSDPVEAKVPGTEPFDPMVADPGSWRLHQVSLFYSCEALDHVGRKVDEELALVALQKRYRTFPLLSIVPEGMQITESDLQKIELSRHHFESVNLF